MTVKRRYRIDIICCVYSAISTHATCIGGDSIEPHPCFVPQSVPGLVAVVTGEKKEITDELLWSEYVPRLPHHFPPALPELFLMDLDTKDSIHVGVSAADEDAYHILIMPLQADR